MASNHYCLARKALSLRDILTIIEFISASKLGKELSIKHALELTILDGVCLGLDASLSEKEQIVSEITEYIDKTMTQVIGKAPTIEFNKIKITDKQLKVDPFSIDRRSNNEVFFQFEAKTTLKNLAKVLRAMTLDKAILLEGPPGVGKTSLIENLARSTGRQLFRVNLSE